MKMDIDVDMGKIAVAKHKDADNLTSTGIGSCLVITLFDAKSKIGALAHPMLSAQSRPAGANGDTTYIDTAIEKMLSKLFSLGVKKEDLEAKIIGAANMFSAFKPDISKKNVFYAREKLKQQDIKLVGECVGGSIGRSVEFALDTGIVTVKTKF